MIPEQLIQAEFLPAAMAISVLLLVLGGNYRKSWVLTMGAVFSFGMTLTIAVSTYQHNRIENTVLVFLVLFGVMSIASLWTLTGLGKLPKEMP